MKGVASFHGALLAPPAEPGKQVRAKILICHGAADPMAKPGAVEQYIAAMEKSGLDWQLIIYGGAKPVEGPCGPHYGVSQELLDELWDTCRDDDGRELCTRRARGWFRRLQGAARGWLILVSIAGALVIAGPGGKKKTDEEKAAFERDLQARQFQQRRVVFFQ